MGRRYAIAFTVLAACILLSAQVYRPLAEPPRHGIGVQSTMGLPRAGLVGLWTFGPDRSLNGSARWFTPGQNLLKWSEDLSNSIWGKAGVTITADAITGPISMADKLVESSGYAEHSLYQQAPGGLTAGAYYTLAVYLRPAERTQACLEAQWPTSWHSIGCFNFLTTSFVNADSNWSFSYIDADDGWYLIAASAKTDTTYMKVGVGPGSGGTPTYAGDGSSGMYAWGFSLIPGSHTAAECEELYQKTEAFQSVHDFSGQGNDLQNGSTTGDDTNDADLRQPWSRNVMPLEYVNDLTNWSCVTGCTVVDSDTVQLDPNAFVYVYPNLVANTYSVFSSTANVAAGTGTIRAYRGDAESVNQGGYAASGRLSSTAGGQANIATPAFTGTGLNDMSINTGTNFSCAADYLPDSNTDVASYVIEIDAAGTPDTFKWSHDGGSTWEATGVAITGSAQSLDCGAQITFANTTGHTVGDKWTAHVYFGYCAVRANPSNTSTITVDITDPQVEYCEDINCTPTAFTDPRSESTVAGAEFDGVDDYAHIGPTDSLDISDGGTVLIVGSAHGSNGFGLQKKSWMYQLRAVGWSYEATVYTCVGSNVADASYSLSLPLYKWIIIGFTFDPSSYLRLWGDGALLKEDTTLTGSPCSSSGDLYIGESSGGSALKTDGDIALAAIYSRALTPSEIKRATCHIAQQMWNWRGIPIRGATDACPSLDFSQAPLHAKMIEPWQRDGTWALATLRLMPDIWRAR